MCILGKNHAASVYFGFWILILVLTVTCIDFFPPAVLMDPQLCVLILFSPLFSFFWQPLGIFMPWIVESLRTKNAWKSYYQILNEKINIDKIKWSTKLRKHRKGGEKNGRVYIGPFFHKSKYRGHALNITEQKWQDEEMRTVYAFPTVFLSKNRNLSVYKGGRAWILTPEWFFLFNNLMYFKIGDHKNNSSIWDNFFVGWGDFEWGWLYLTWWKFLIIQKNT